MCCAGQYGKFDRPLSLLKPFAIPVCPAAVPHLSALFIWLLAPEFFIAIVVVHTSHLPGNSSSLPPFYGIKAAAAA